MSRRGFTLLESMMVVAIVPVLAAILVPPLQNVQKKSMVDVSRNNIRNVFTANINYGSDSKGRQWVGAPDDLARHGDNIGEAISGYLEKQKASDTKSGKWSPGPGVQLGETDNGQVWFCGNVPVYITPYSWGSGPTSATQAPRYGTFLHPNTRQVAQYMDGRVYNRAYFAPKDAIVLKAVEACINSAGNLCPGANGYGGQPGNNATFDIEKFGGYSFPPFLHPSSYVYSPANMVNPEVYAVGDEDEANMGFKDPCTFDSGFRAPTLDQAKYPSLKTYLMEHHWLQNVQGDPCSPRWPAAQYPYRQTNNNKSGWHWDGCYPAMAVHSFRSAPVTCFADGHVALMKMNDCDKSDSIVMRATKEESGVLMGTWHRGTWDRDEGYWLEASTDWIDVSPHFHTARGIQGRDIISPSAPGQPNR